MLADGTSRNGTNSGQFAPANSGGSELERLVLIKHEMRRVTEHLHRLRAEVERTELELMRLDGEEGELVLALGAIDPRFKTFSPPLIPEEAEAYGELYAAVGGA